MIDREREIEVENKRDVKIFVSKKNRVKRRKEAAKERVTSRRLYSQQGTLRTASTRPPWYSDFRRHVNLGVLA